MTTLLDLSSRGLNFIPFNIIRRNKKINTLLLNNNNIEKLINFSEFSIIKKIDLSHNKLTTLDSPSVNIINEAEGEEKKENEEMMDLLASPKVAKRRDTKKHGVKEEKETEEEKKKAQKNVENRRDEEYKKNLNEKAAQFKELQAKYNILEEEKKNKQPGYKPR